MTDSTDKPKNTIDDGSCALTNKPVTCERIQDVLFDYMTHELGNKQSVLVREHLQHCEACRKEASSIQSTLTFLKRDTSIKPPEHLSNTVRQRLERILLHPILDWIYIHRRLVAIIAALFVITILAVLAGVISANKPETITYWINKFQ